MSFSVSAWTLREKTIRPPTASPIPIISIAAPATIHHRVAFAPVFKGSRSSRCASSPSFRGFLSGIYPAYFRNQEPIASLWNCRNVSGILGVIVQRLPQLAYRHPEAAVKIDERIARPETPSKFLPADYLSRVFQERDQEPMG